MENNFIKQPTPQPLVQTEAYVDIPIPTSITTNIGNQNSEGDNIQFDFSSSNQLSSNNSQSTISEISISEN